MLPTPAALDRLAAELDAVARVLDEIGERLAASPARLAEPSRGRLGVGPAPLGWLGPAERAFGRALHGARGALVEQATGLHADAAAVRRAAVALAAEISVLQEAEHTAAEGLRRLWRALP